MRILFLLLFSTQFLIAQSNYARQLVDTDDNTAVIQSVSQFNPWVGATIGTSIKGSIMAQMELTEEFNLGSIKLPYSVGYGNVGELVFTVSPYYVFGINKPTKLVVHAKYDNLQRAFFGFEILTELDQNYFTLSIGAAYEAARVFPDITGLLKINQNSALFFNFKPSESNKELNLGIILMAE